MAHQSLSACPLVAPTQVWVCLNADHQTKIIRFMAQLAFNLIAAQAELPGKEPTYAHSPHRQQDPTRAS